MSSPPRDIALSLITDRSLLSSVSSPAVKRMMNSAVSGGGGGEKIQLFRPFEPEVRGILQYMKILLAFTRPENTNNNNFFNDTIEEEWEKQ